MEGGNNYEIKVFSHLKEQKNLARKLISRGFIQFLRTPVSRKPLGKTNSMVKGLIKDMLLPVE